VKSLGSRRRTNSFTRRHTMKGNGTKGKIPQKGKNLNKSKVWVSNPKEILSRKRVPLKWSQLKGDVSGKPKGTYFNFNEVHHYSKDCFKPKPRNGGSKVIALIANLAQSERNCLIF
jgi:hypothetical protein